MKGYKEEDDLVMLTGAHQPNHCHQEEKGSHNSHSNKQWYVGVVVGQCPCCHHQTDEKQGYHLRIRERCVVQ